MSSKIFGITLLECFRHVRDGRKKKNEGGGGGRDPGEGWSSVAQLDNVFLRLLSNESDQAG